MAGKDTFRLDELGPDPENSERMRRMKRLMRELYKEEFESKRFRLPPIKAKSLIVSLSFISIIIFGVTTLYNFNRFVTLEERVLSANGHVEDVLQRRSNLFENLINLTLNQSALEQEVFRHVADVRSNIGKGMQQNHGPVEPPRQGMAVQPSLSQEGLLSGSANTVPEGPVDHSMVANSKLPTEIMAGLNGVPAMARLLAVVEQYPEIRSSVTYQQLMDKLVEIENRIALRRDEFNEEVRIYNTLISSFPWYVLANVTGFERYHYFSVGSGMNAEAFKMPDVSTHRFSRLLPVGMAENQMPVAEKPAMAQEKSIDSVPAEIKQESAENK
ncbi:MAG: LemA family protein [Magnetococcales bacterium]|nr:LemA family protein [Magnetococcales bacterium]